MDKKLMINPSKAMNCKGLIEEMIMKCENNIDTNFNKIVDVNLDQYLQVD